MSLLLLKTALRDRLVNADRANSISVLELGRFLLALEKAETQSELKALEDRLLKLQARTRNQLAGA